MANVIYKFSDCAYQHSLSLCFFLQHQLQMFMDTTFEKILNTERALDMLKKFERFKQVHFLLGIIWKNNANNTNIL